MKLNGNLTFLGGGVAENLRIESLTDDPATPLDQQVWANAIEERVKTKLGSSIVVLASMVDINNLQSEVDTSQTSLGLNNDGSLAAFTNANYIGEATTLRGAIVTLDSELKSGNDAVAAEETRALAAEAAIQAELDASQASSGLNIDGSLAAFTNANYIGEATTLREALVDLDDALLVVSDALDDEVTRATAAEATLTSNLAAETTAREAADSILAADLAAEVTNRTNAISAEETARIAADNTIRTDFEAADSALETTLTGLIEAEETARIAADAALQASLDALGNAFNYVGTLTGGVDEENATDLALLSEGGKDTGDYYKVSANGYFKIGEEGTPFFARQNDGLVWNSVGAVDIIDNTNSVVLGTENFVDVTGSPDTGFVVNLSSVFKTRISTLETDLVDEETARIAADTTLTNDLAAEVTRATAAEASLATNLAAETSAREAADTTLTTNLDAEVTRATAAEASLATDIADEETRALAAEAAIQAELDASQSSIGLNIDGSLDAFTSANYIDEELTLRGALVTLDTTAKTIADALAAEVTRATAAEAALAARMDGGYFLYNGSTASQSHVVTHNLGNKYAAVTVVDANDNVIIPQSITFDSSNQLTVTFNTSITCKVVVNGLKAA